MISIGWAEHIQRITSRKRTDETWATTRAPLSVIWFTGAFPLRCIRLTEKIRMGHYLVYARVRIKIIQNRTQILHYHDDAKWRLGNMGGTCYYRTLLFMPETGRKPINHFPRASPLRHLLRQARTVCTTRTLSPRQWDFLYASTKLAFKSKRVGGYLVFLLFC